MRSPLLTVAWLVLWPALAADAGQNMGKQDAALKMSPQDKTYGKVQGESDKFSANNKAPAGQGSEPAKAESEPEKPAKILDDYDPNRIGVPADQAEDSAKLKDKEGSVDKAAGQAAKETEPDLRDPKSGFSTGQGKNSGGVGAAAEVAAPANDVETSSPSPATPELPNQSTESQYHGYDHFVMTVSMIVVSEIGDKTFLIAAIMAMKHHPWFVFSASFSSLAIMTLLSTFLGQILPSLFSKKVTTLLAAVLFLIFGASMLREALAMDPGTDAQEELHEVEQEIELK